MAAAVLIALALALAGLGFMMIFDRVLDARAAQDLDRTAKFLAGQATLGPDGKLSLETEPPDPRYAAPYSGSYWQIEGVRDAALRSRSLWDKSLDRAAFAPGASTAQTIDLTGPDGGRLLAVVRQVVIDQNGAEAPVVIAVATDRRNLAESRATYVNLLVPSLIALGAVLTLAMAVFVQRALSPLAALRADLRAVHEGRQTLLPAHFPDEVQPLVDDLNRLIGVQEKALTRARVQAGDMAHGLKTPLAVLTALARRSADEHPDLAGGIDEQVLLMRRQVERSLVRARIAASADLRRRACAVAPVVTRLVAALRRLPEADSLSWEISLLPSLTYPGDEGDLTELLGNLLDNARKWAHRRVVIAALSAEAEEGLVVEDDGPGMSEAAMSQTGRGLRWDETKPGTGFGLAISADIAEETGSRLSLSRSALGGLRVELAWRRSGMSK